MTGRDSDGAATAARGEERSRVGLWVAKEAIESAIPMLSRSARIFVVGSRRGRQRGRAADERAEMISIDLVAFNDRCVKKSRV